MYQPLVWLIYIEGRGDGIYLWLNEAKHNERDGNWFLEIPSEMIVCGSVVILEMCEAGEVCECKDASI